MDDRKLWENGEGYKDPTSYVAITQHEYETCPPIYRGSLYRIGMQIGLVVSNHLNNKHSGRLEVVYLGAVSLRKPLPTHVKVEVFGQPQTIHCEQICTVKREAIGRCIKALTSEEMRAVDRALAISIGLADVRGVDDSDKEAELMLAQAERDLYKKMYQRLLQRFETEGR